MSSAEVSFVSDSENDDSVVSSSLSEEKDSRQSDVEEQIEIPESEEGLYLVVLMFIGSLTSIYFR
jgi:hypothetical protein